MPPTIENSQAVSYRPTSAPLRTQTGGPPTRPTSVGFSDSELSFPPQDSFVSSAQEGIGDLNEIISRNQQLKNWIARTPVLDPSPSVSPNPADLFVKTTNMANAGVLEFRELAREGGYSATFGGPGSGSNGVNVYQDEASKTLPKDWRQETQPDGVNAYSNNNQSPFPKVTIRKKKRPVETATPKPPAATKPKSQPKREPKPTPWQGPPVPPPELKQTKPAVPMKLIDPKSTNPNNWLDKTLEFMEDNYAGSGLSPKLLGKLKSLHQNGKIVIKDLGPEKLGGYNHLTRKITLNSSKFLFLQRDFKKQLDLVERNGPPERVQQIKDQHAASILELSGTLIHEGEHAFNYQWNDKSDETAAFTIEQLWYHHLHGLDSDYKDQVSSLSWRAEDDAKTSPTYEGLDINAPSFIRQEK